MSGCFFLFMFLFFTIEQNIEALGSLLREADNKTPTKTTKILTCLFYKCIHKKLNLNFL